MNEILEKIMTELGASRNLAIAYLIVGVLVGIMAVICLILEINIWIRYSRANRKDISSKMTGIDAARFVLDRSGHPEINVRKAGFIREAIFGNHYNIYSKTVYLRGWLGRIDKKKTVTSVALGVQKAAVARLCEEGDTSARIRNRLFIIGIFGPLLFIPVLLLGLVVDMLVLNEVGMFTYICMGISGLLVIAGFIVTMLNIPVERKANKLALEMMEEYGLATGDELDTMKDVYKAYILSYIAEFILEILRIVQWILEIIIKIKQNDK